MISVNTLYDFLTIILNKEQSGSSGFSPEMYNTLLPRARDDFFKKMYGMPEEYQPGLPETAIGWEVTQYVTDALKDLKSDPTQLPVDSDGKVIYPTDYIHMSSAGVKHAINANDCDTNQPTVKEVEIDWIKDNQYRKKICSTIAPPTKMYPIGVQYKTYMQLYPKDLQYMFLTYFKYPADPVFGYTVDPTTDQVIYDPATTTDLDLPQIHTNDIARFILSYLGINLREEMLLQYAEAKKLQGV